MPIYDTRNLAVAAALIFAIGCVSKNAHQSVGSVPNTVQNPDAGATLEKLIATNDAANPILSDDDLITKFQIHHETFEQLRQMIIADPKLHRVDCDWTDPTKSEDAGVSPDRINEYRRLLNKVGCHRGFYSSPGIIYFISAAQGTVVNSQDQGYYYSEGTPIPLVTNTATYRPNGSVDSYKAFRHIEGHWYVCYVRN